MPDIVSPQIVAFGRLDTVQSLYDFLSPQNGGFSFNRFIPGPWNGSSEEYENYHEWRCTNWETKWDCFDVTVELISDGDEGHVRIGYSCPWNASLPVHLKLAEMYPNLSYLVCEQTYPYVGSVVFSEFRAGLGIRDLLFADAEIVEVGGRVRCEYSYRGSRQFIADWQQNSSIKKAMKLLGFDEQKRRHITEVMESTHSGKRPLETASHTF